MQCNLKYSPAVVTAAMTFPNTPAYIATLAQFPNLSPHPQATAIIAAKPNLAQHAPPYYPYAVIAAAAAASNPKLLHNPQAPHQQPIPAAAASNPKSLHNLQAPHQQPIPAAMSANSKPYQNPLTHSQQPVTVATIVPPNRFYNPQAAQKPAAAAASPNPAQSTNNVCRQFKADYQALKPLAKAKDNTHDDDHRNSCGLTPMS